jgi:two-component system NtrC family sensor kinase
MIANFKIQAVALGLLFSIIIPIVAACKPIIFKDGFGQDLFSKEVKILIDSTQQLTFKNVAEKGEFNYNQKSIIFFLKDQTLWGRFSVTNNSVDSALFFSVLYPHISDIQLYKADDNGKLNLLIETGNEYNFSSRLNRYVDFNFDLQLPVGKTATYYFTIKSQHPVELQMSLMSQPQLVATHNLQAIIMAAFMGVMISLLLYNLFLFFATADKSYLVYVFFLFSLVAAQFTVAGWSFKYFWPNHPDINNYAVVWTSCLTFVAAIVFAILFLRTSTYLPRIHKVLLAFIGVQMIGFILSISSFRLASYQILNISGITCSVILLYVSAAIYLKGYRPALYYLFAWASFLVGIIILVFRNVGFLPTNIFTTYILYAGSAITSILLSIALADKITILRREKEVSQLKALQISQENEQLVKEQNLLLEQKVTKRTEELQLAHQEITTAFKNLQDAQLQLVESEKMASLGLLTAGIAHEINNPINFVKSNIKPLQLDFKDLIELMDQYGTLHSMDEGEIVPQLQKIEILREEIGLDFVKTEIINLMKGIENGAERTAEIVRGLRTFSRLDESVIKVVDIHEGIDSTLILLRSNIPSYIAIEKDYQLTEEIECFPGKLNQVFMNILSNSVQAIKEKPQIEEKEKISISTRSLNESQIEIRIKDSGKGMSEEVKQKIFEPFFTTKEVGEGTGLGLAIVFKIIQEHVGKIEVISNEGFGSEFIITLNISIPNKSLS